MRELVLVTMLLGTMACASQPGRDGPATPTSSDTVRYPGDADDPLDFPPERGGGTDSTRGPR
jgi:hypothetical protein